MLDVSEAQAAPINWSRVAQSVRHVIVRACHGTQRDRLAQRHADSAHHVGLTVSLYGYARPAYPADEQAELLASMLHELGCEGTAWVDLEEAGRLDPEHLAAWLSAYLLVCDRLVGDVRRTGIYTGPAFWATAMKDHGAQFCDRALWLAQYGARGPHAPDRWLDALLWQHAGNTIVRLPDGSERWRANARNLPGAVVIAEPGHVDGVPCEVDVSELRGTMADLLTGHQPRIVPDLATVLGRQQALRLLGHDPGLLDGLWGSRSRAALVLAQRALGLTADGVWGPLTSAAIENALAAR